MRRAAMRGLRYWVRALGVVQVRCDSDVRKVRYNDKEKVSATPPKQLALSDGGCQQSGGGSRPRRGVHCTPQVVRFSRAVVC